MFCSGRDPKRVTETSQRWVYPVHRAVPGFGRGAVLSHVCAGTAGSCSPQLHSDLRCCAKGQRSGASAALHAERLELHARCVCTLVVLD